MVKGSISLVSKASNNFFKVKLSSNIFLPFICLTTNLLCYNQVVEQPKIKAADKLHSIGYLLMIKTYNLLLAMLRLKKIMSVIIKSVSKLECLMLPITTLLILFLL